MLNSANTTKGNSCMFVLVFFSSSSNDVIKAFFLMFLCCCLKITQLTTKSDNVINFFLPQLRSSVFHGRPHCVRTISFSFFIFLILIFLIFCFVRVISRRLFDRLPRYFSGRIRLYLKFVSY